MSIGIYPVFDRRFEGNFSDQAAAVLLDEMQALETLAAARGVRSLESFHAYAHVDLPADFDGDPHEVWFQHEPHWNDPTETAAAVETLMGAVLTERPVFEKHDIRAVLEALEALRLAVEAARRFGARVNLQVMQL